MLTFLPGRRFAAGILGKRVCALFTIGGLLIASTGAVPPKVEEAVPLETTLVAPVSVQQRESVLFADFGRDAYGNLQIDLATAPKRSEIVGIRLGEKLAQDGAIDRHPPGSVNYRELTLPLVPERTHYRLKIPSKPFHLGAASVKMPAYIGEVTPFRYVEIESAEITLEGERLRQCRVHAPFDEEAATFESSDPTLNAVWDLCHYTMEGTSAFGVYIDGERERISYEADAYINQLSHYACDLDPRVARATFHRLMAKPTWPTEWSFHMPMIAAEDYRATGDAALAGESWDALKAKLLRDRARSDGLLRANAIVDWPSPERDDYNEGKPAPGDPKQVGPEINTVANAFYYHALREMAMLARALDKKGDAMELDMEAGQVYQSFNRVFWDTARAVYRDGEGAMHASLHANMFPLAFGLVPAERVNSVANFVQSRGMACSVYGAQYLLDALFAAHRGDAAVALMTDRGKRSWWHMIELGSTMTLEAWDAEYKPNLTWNHAWGAAPANLISRYILGVRPLQPGYSEILIAPQLGALAWVRGKVPTARGPVVIEAKAEKAYTLDVIIPSSAKARIQVPRRKRGQLLLDGQPPSAATVRESDWVLDLPTAGKHHVESQ